MIYLKYKKLNNTMKDLKPKIKKFIVFMTEQEHRDLKVASAKSGKAMNLIMTDGLRKELKTILKQLYENNY